MLHVFPHSVWWHKYNGDVMECTIFFCMAQVVQISIAKNNFRRLTYILLLALHLQPPHCTHQKQSEYHSNRVRTASLYLFDNTIYPKRYMYICNEIIRKNYEQLPDHMWWCNVRRSYFVTVVHEQLPNYMLVLKSTMVTKFGIVDYPLLLPLLTRVINNLSLIHIWRCRRRG